MLIDDRANERRAARSARSTVPSTSSPTSSIRSVAPPTVSG
jgi:hypothetical protein